MHRHRDGARARGFGLRCLVARLRADSGIWLVVLAEPVAILSVAPHRWRWMVEHPLEPLIMLLTPPIVPASLQSDFTTIVGDLQTAPDTKT